MNKTERIIDILIYIILISIFTHVFHVKKYLRYILKRKRVFFRKGSASLSTAINSLQKYVLTENTLMTVEEQAAACVQVIAQNLSRVLANRAVQLSLTGGTAERFGVPLSSKWITINGDINDNHALISDFDFMLQLDQVYSSREPKEGHFTIDTLGCEVGYSRLVVSNQQTKPVFGLNSQYLSARFVKNKVYQAICETDISIYPGFVQYTDVLCFKNSKNHFVQLKTSGPAIKLEIGTGSVLYYHFMADNNNQRFTGKVNTNQFLADITFSIPCKEWPSISDWPSRLYRHWPRTADVERIVNLGCHLVPKSQKDDADETTWRFSFSQAEVELSKLITANARNCFLALKVIHKDFLVFTCPELTSYHLKTILLNKLETTGLDFWSADNTEVAFLSLLEDLRGALDTKTCNHYWIPQVNLFKDIAPHKLNSVSKVVAKVIQNPSPYIQQSERQSSWFRIIGWNAPVVIDDVEVAVTEYEEVAAITNNIADVKPAGNAKVAISVEPSTSKVSAFGGRRQLFISNEISTPATENLEVVVAAEASPSTVLASNDNGGRDGEDDVQIQISRSIDNVLSENLQFSSSAIPIQQQQKQPLLNVKSSASGPSSSGIRRDYGSFQTTIDDDIELACRMDFHTTLPKQLRDIFF